MIFISHLCPLCPPTYTISLSTLSPFQMTSTALLFSSPGNLPNNPFKDTREKVSFIAFLFGCLIFLHISVKSYTLFYTVVYNSSFFLVSWHLFLITFIIFHSRLKDQLLIIKLAPHALDIFLARTSCFVLIVLNA